MVTINTALRALRKRRRDLGRHPLDKLGVAALIWCGVFVTLAFTLGCLLR